LLQLADHLKTITIAPGHFQHAGDESQYMSATISAWKKNDRFDRIAAYQIGQMTICFISR
jgi:hypothetical protein